MKHIHKYNLAQKGLGNLMGEALQVNEGKLVGVGGVDADLLNRFCVGLLDDIALSNSPVLVKDQHGSTKRPLLLHITFHEKAFVRHLNGFFFKTVKVDQDLANLDSLLCELEQQGYCVQVMTMDAHSDFVSSREKARALRQVSVKHNLLVIAPLALNGDAEELLDKGCSEESFVVLVSSGGYYKADRMLNAELDMEMFIHPVTTSEGKFLTIKKGKHRGAKESTEDYLKLPWA